jgi:microcystin-dependent protein
MAVQYNVRATISGTYYASFTTSASLTFDQIKRATQPTLSASSVNMGGSVTINMPRASSAFTHDLAYSFAGSGYTAIATGVGTSYAWTVPDLASKIPNSTSGVVTIRCITKSGSTTVGTKTVTLTAKVPTSVVPTISAVAVTETVSGLAAQFGAFIQNKSAIKCTITAAGAKGSTIKSYSSTFMGLTYTGSTWTSRTLSAAGTLAIVTTVTDSRGRTAKKTTNVTVLDYSPPVISALRVYRCTADGTPADDGTALAVAYAYSVPSLNGGNTAQAVLAYKRTTASEYTRAYTATALSQNRTQVVTSATFSTDYQYDVQLQVTDWFGTVTPYRAVLPSAEVILDIGADGKSLAIFKTAEQSGALEIAGDARITGTQERLGNKYTFSTPGEAGTAGYILLARIKITAANADTPITFVLSSRQHESPMTVHVSLRNSTTTASSLGSIRYEGSNYGAFLVKLDAMTWDLYVQKGSTYDTITLQDWWTSKTMDSRIAVTFPGTLAVSLPDTYYRATPLVAESIIDCFMPVGYILLLYSHADPNTMYPGTTWVRIYGAFPWFTDANGQIGLTGGERNVTLTVDQLPTHTHGSVYSGNVTGTKTHDWLASGGSAMAYGTVSAGSGEAHNNMPPYIQISAWRRTA